MALPDSIAKLLDNVNQTAHMAPTDGEGSVDEAQIQTTGTKRHKLLAAAKELVAALEDPEEEAWRFVLHPYAHACLVSAWQCGILTEWEKPTMTSKELAEKYKVDRKLVVRLMRVIMIYAIFREVAEETYEHTKASLYLSTPPFGILALPMAARAFTIGKLPEYLSLTGWRNPGDDPDEKSLFQYANNTNLSYFDWMQTQPEILKDFNDNIAISAKTSRFNGKGFADLYPFERLGENLLSPNDIVLVDVGGGYGHILAEIQECSALRGKMALEDLPATVANHVPLQNTEIVSYNFLTTEQPLKDARAYMLRHVLHDWPDHVCRQILLNVTAGITNPNARILIAEIILPDMNPPVLGSLMDIVMMKYGGEGRKQREWFEIFESAGLEVVKVWPPFKQDSIMELALKSN